MSFISKTVNSYLQGRKSFLIMARVSLLFGREITIFRKGKLFDHVTLGHGKSETEEWDPEKEMLTALADSKRDIARYKGKKRGSPPTAPCVN